MDNHIFKEKNEQIISEAIKESSGKCPICESGNNDFVVLNASTLPFSGIEIAASRQGMLRVRSYTSKDYISYASQDYISYTSQEIIMIKFCPICGRKF